MQKRALIITDSLGAPRYEPNTLTYEQTWVYGVKKYLEEQNYDVFAITHNGLHSQELLTLAQTKLNLYSAEIVIMQFGIVDCAPRVLRDREIRILRFLKLGKFAHKIAKKYHAPLSNLRNITLFAPDTFKTYVSQIYGLLKQERTRIIQIPIAPACSGYLKISPRIDRNIQLYNDILKQHADIYLHDFTNMTHDECERIFMSDHHHLNQTGHDYLKNKVVEKIETLL